MIGNLFINGIDIFAEHGIFIAEGGYNGLISHANLKEINYNNWAEKDGIQPDLSNPKLDTKEFSILFGSTNSYKTENFIASLSENAYCDFDLKEIGVTRKLRILSQQNKNTVGSLEAFSLQFADDFPLNGYSYQAPVNPINQSGFNIDGKPLANYGIWVLEGSFDEIMKIPPVKKNLLINYRNFSGADYDNDRVIYEAKDVALNCALRASSINTFWRNYNAFIYDLIRPNERLFYVADVNDTFKCFYKSCSVRRFTIVRKEVWCEFTLTLTFTNFRPKAIHNRTYLLINK